MVQETRKSSEEHATSSVLLSCLELPGCCALA